MTVRVALLGYGLGGEVFHAPLLATTPGVTLAAIVTGDPERQARARRDHPKARVVATAEELWAMSGDLDAAVVTTANIAHVPLALAALDHGLHVVVDKPMAATADAARLVVTAAQRAGRLLSVFHNRRWDGDFLTVRRLVADGALGTVTRFESRFERWRPSADLTKWRESGDPAHAGGLLYDLGTHLIDQAVVLFGPVDAVYAEVDRRRPGVEADDDVFVALTHTSGVRSHLWASAVAGRLGPRLRVLGTESAYSVWGMDPQEDALRAGGRPDRPGWGEAPPEHYGQLGPDGSDRPVPTVAGAYQRFYEGFVAAVEHGAPPPVDPLDAVVVAELVEAAFRSSATGQVVRPAARGD